MGSSPSATHLISEAARLAESAGAPLVAAHVRADGDAEREDRALRHLREAQLHGARIIELDAEDIALALVVIAREEQASLVVLGKPVRSTRRSGSRTIADRLIDLSEGLPIVLVGDPLPHGQRHHTLREKHPRRWSTGVTIGVLVTILLLLLSSRTLPPSLSLLLAALATMWLGRRMRVSTAAILGAILGFVPSLHVATGVAPAAAPLVYLFVSPALVAVIGGLMAGLQARIPAHEAAARERERHLSRLHLLGTELAAARDHGSVARHCLRTLRESLDATVEWVDADAELAEAPWATLVGQPSSRREPVGQGTRTDGESPWLLHPLRSQDSFFGWLALSGGDPSYFRDPRRMLFVGSVARIASVALERVQLASIAEEKQMLAAAERVRSDLLSSVSHDLRTPLGAILGASSWLRRRLETVSRETAEELLGSIEKEAQRLERTLQNLLALTRLSGRPSARRDEWQLEEDIIAAAVDRLDAELDRQRIHVELSESKPLLGVDALLMELVLVNLVDNAFRHGGDGVQVRIVSTISNEHWQLDVIDDGRGIPAEERALVFDRFFRGQHSGALRGSGLGLAICRAAASAHDGTIALVDAPLASEQSGAHVRIILPVGTISASTPPPEPIPPEGKVMS